MRKRATMSQLRVLVGCEFSGIVRDAFLAIGADAWSCDLLPTERPGPHIMDDVRNVLDAGWDVGIFHPPCTYLANSGVQHLYIDGKKENGIDPVRWRQMVEGAELFKALWLSGIPHIAIENPVMHGYGKQRIGVNQSQTIQPWQFGHGEIKATCLWLKNLPLLRPTAIVSGRYARVHLEPPGPERAKNRSRTYEGIAAAFATQWGTVDLTVQADMFERVAS